MVYATYVEKMWRKRGGWVGEKKDEKAEKSTLSSFGA